MRHAVTPAGVRGAGATPGFHSRDGEEIRIFRTPEFAGLKGIKGSNGHSTCREPS